MKMFSSALLAIVISCFGFAICDDDYVVTEEVWFDIAVDDFDGEKIVNNQVYTGRIVIGCFGDVAPSTCMNFQSIAKGHNKKGQFYHYKDSPVHRVVQDFVIQMGDITNGDGTGGKSIYGDSFFDEEFVISHNAQGIVSMANSGPDSNNSQFFILLTKARWLDGHHVAFGKVIRGYEFVKTLGDIPTDGPSPRVKVKIVDSGINMIKAKYSLTAEQLMSTEDI